MNTLFSNVGLFLQILAIFLFFAGLVISYKYDKPTIFSYKAYLTNILKKDDYFESKSPQNIELGLVYNGATQKIVNGLLEVVKVMKTGDILAAEKIFQGLPKNNLTPTDITNIQSTRAAIEFTKGNLATAKSIYQSIIDTGTNSNAVFLGMGNIAAFETLKFYKSDTARAIALLHESNEWYLKALAGDQRPKVLVHIYYGLYDNYKRLVEYFGQSEQEGLEQYRGLFLENNQKAGNPY